MEPLVSICCATYNHAPYLAAALESFLAQKTDFPVEILVHDDASTDGTDAILRDYAQRYPKLIHPLFETCNQYSQGVPIDPTFNYPRARGAYIALCEGDDWWTDPHKLQRQADYMRAHPECTFLFTNGDVCTVPGDAPERPFLPWPGQDCPFDPTRDRALNLADMCGLNFAPTASFFFRRSALDALPDAFWQKRCAHGDLKLRLFLTAAGAGGYLAARTCMYRQNVQSGAMSLWARQSGRAAAERARSAADMLLDVDTFSQGRYHEAVSRMRDWYLYVQLVSDPGANFRSDPDLLRLYRSLSPTRRLKHRLKRLLVPLREATLVGRNRHANQRHP